MTRTIDVDNEDCPTCWSCGDDLDDPEGCYCVYCDPEQFETEGEGEGESK